MLKVRMRSVARSHAGLRHAMWLRARHYGRSGHAGHFVHFVHDSRISNESFASAFIGDIAGYKTSEVAGMAAFHFFMSATIASLTS